MAKYRIKIEPLDPAEADLRFEYRAGFDVDNFLIAAGVGDGVCACLQDLSIASAAALLCQDREMARTVCVAHGMLEAANHLYLSQLFETDDEEED